MCGRLPFNLSGSGARTLSKRSAEESYQCTGSAIERSVTNI
jgi:hypothetical protein